MIARIPVYSAFFLTAFMLSAPAFAEDVDPPTFTWMLPRTVLDVTVIYTYGGLVDGQPKIKITPTITARAVPDVSAGHRGIATKSLVSFWEDRNITITTANNTHILTSVSSNPVNQTSSIIGNILGGVGKLVAVSLGVPAAAVDAGGKKCPDNWAPLVESQQTQMRKLQLELATGPADDIQKRDTAQILALQTLLTDEQSKMSLTIHGTIDPGFTNPEHIVVDPEAKPDSLPSQPGAVQKGGLIASLMPTDSQLAHVMWGCLPNPVRDLQVNVYLDFKNASVPDKNADDHEHKQTIVVNHDDTIISYREVSYIPVEIWRGNKNGPASDKPVELAPAQAVPFAQYGTEQTLPLNAPTFKNFKWSISFAESGEITNASFASLSWGKDATSLFQTAASATNGIATEQRTAANPETAATLKQGQSDEIYQTQRLALCESTPTSCPGK
jgi:hypothetical protein